MNSSKRLGAFTLIELLVAVAISSLLLVLLFGVIQQVSKISKRVGGSATAFDSARGAFSQVQLWLSQATLTPYWEVVYTADGEPEKYVRKSDLHFLCGKTADLHLPGQSVGSALFFLAPLGFDPNLKWRDSALNAVGIFCEYRNVNIDKPFSWAIQERWRFQLRALYQPSPEVRVFDPDDATGRRWFTDPLASANPPVVTLAENILLFVARPRSVLHGTEVVSYDYDSRAWKGSGSQPQTSHQLPGFVDVVMIACDESTAIRMDTPSTQPTFPAGLFSDPKQFEEDIQTFERWLATTYPQGIFQTFRATVPIRAAKWSLDPSSPS